MEIKILGTGCPKCKRLEQLAHEAVAEAGVEAHIVHVTDMDGIMAYPIMSTPGLVINEELKSSGRLPRKEEIVAWLRAA
ncbi:MAG: thioredoxin family protein [Anaerolineae bacterium]